MSCDYQGYEFGAGYLDSVCIDGALFDADDCDEHGNLYEKENQPCPKCRQLAAMHWYADRWIDDLDERWPRYSAWHLVMDIRRNRGLRSVPFLVFLVHRAWRAARWAVLRRWWRRKPPMKDPQ